MKWIVAIRRDIGKHFQVTTHRRVCSRHFKPSDYLPSLTGRKRTLKPTAVPSVFHWKKRSPVKRKVPTRRSPVKRKKATEKATTYESWFTNVRFHVRCIFVVLDISRCVSLAVVFAVVFGATGNSFSLVNHRKIGKYYSRPTSWWLTKYHSRHSHWKWNGYVKKSTRSRLKQKILSWKWRNRHIESAYWRQEYSRWIDLNQIRMQLFTQDFLTELCLKRFFNFGPWK